MGTKGGGTERETRDHLTDLKEAAALQLELLLLGCSADLVWSELPMVIGMPNGWDDIIFLVFPF